MTEKKVLLSNETGMHARPAGQFVKLAQKYQSQVSLVFGEKKANGKSVMSLLTLGLQKDSEFLLQVDGADESEALAALVQLVESQFQVAPTT